MTGVYLEQIDEKDLEFVKDVYNYYILNSTAIFYLHPLSDQDIREIVPVNHSRYKSFLIKAANKTCGFCYITKFKPKEAFDITVEITIYLLPDYGGQGIGYEAMQLFEPYIRDAGFSNVIGLITDENIPSIRLFEKSGYTCCGHIKQVAAKFERKLGLVMYQKLLQE